MKKNIIANIIGRFWGVISNFLFIPLYIKILGLESYSIISFALVVEGLLAVMDSGLTSTLAREFASSKNSNTEKYNIFKTLETTYFIISFVVIVLVVLVSSFLAQKWLNLSGVNSNDVAEYLKIIGVGVGFNFLAKFYTGGMIGLEKQVRANMYKIAWGVTRNGLVIVPILFYQSLSVFFVWQTIVTIIYVILIRLDLITITGNSKKLFWTKPNIDKQILKNVWKFAGGMMLIAIVASINTQLDKLVLSKLLPISVLGLYTLAFSLSRGLNLLPSPISMAVLPRLTSYVTSNNKLETKKLFKKSYLLVAIIVFSFAAGMVFYSKDLIWIWTNDIQLAYKSYRYVPWIVLGSVFLIMQGIPFNIAVANGYTIYNNILGILSLFITIPGYWFFIKLYGGIGAAIIFAIVQVVLGVIYLFLINRKFLNLSYFKLLIKNFIVPMIISIFVVYLSKYVLSIENRWLLLLWIGIVVIVAIQVNILVLVPFKDIKLEVLKIIKKYGNKNFIDSSTN